MAEQRLGLIMHGVTGRMGYNQHLVRSILAIRDQGGIALNNGDRLVLDPIIVGRDADKIEALAKKHNIARWGTDLDAALANPDDTVFFDAGTTLMRAALLERAHRRRQARLLRKADFRRPRRRRGPGQEGPRLRHQAWRGAGQAVPAGPLEAQNAARLRLFRQDPLGARRVRLLGLRRRLAGRPSARPGITARPMAAASSSICSATGAMCSTISSARSRPSPASAPPTFPSASTKRATASRPIPTMRPMPPSSSKAASSPRSIPAGSPASAATISSPSMSMAPMARPSRACTNAGPSIASIRPSRCGTPTSPRPSNFFNDWEEVPDNWPAQNGFKAQWEMFLKHVAEDAPWPYGLEAGAKGVQLAELGLKSWAERRWLDVPKLDFDP